MGAAAGCAATGFGATAGAGKILNLDETKMANAFGVSGHLSQVPTWIRQTFAEHRSMTKYGVPGWQDRAASWPHCWQRWAIWRYDAVRRP